MKRLKNFLKIDKYLFLIVVLAAALRFSYLEFSPPSLNWDEVSHGYNAYSILKTGRDEWGVSFPTILRAYGDYKLPVYIYLTAISESLFGLIPFAVRLPSALAGVGTAIFTYLLVIELFRTSHAARYKLLATISAFLVAVEPWSLFLSRGAFEANMALFFIVAGVFFFLKSFLGKKSIIYNPFSAILLGLSVWTYNSARIFTPLLILVLLAVYREEVLALFRKHKKVLAFFFFLFAFFLVPMFYQLFNPAGQARYGKVAIIDEGAINKIIDYRLKIKEKLTDPFPQLLSNKVTYFAKEFSRNYFSHFLPDFLFFKGGTHYQFSLPGKGLLYLINLPFLILGLFFLARDRSKSALILISWFLLGPLASSLTREAPHALRAITMLPAPMIISAYGLSKISNRLTTLVYIIVVALLAENYLTHYFTQYRQNYSWSWQYGYKEVVDFARNSYERYDKIIVTKKYGEPHEFFLFFWPWDPAKYSSDPNLIRFYQSGWWWVDRFDKFYFVNDWDISKDKNDFTLESRKETVRCTLSTESAKLRLSASRCLLITSPDNYPAGWKKLETVNFLDGKPAFEIYEN